MRSIRSILILSLCAGTLIYLKVFWLAFALMILEVILAVIIIDIAERATH